MRKKTKFQLTKELLGAILGFSVVKFDIVDTNIVAYDGTLVSENEEWNTVISIAEFEQKCALWALKLGFETHISYKWGKTPAARYVNICVDDGEKLFYDFDSKIFLGSSLPAFQWILEKMK